MTLYEKDSMLGGDISSACNEGMDHDVYPHLFCDWYREFLAASSRRISKLSEPTLSSIAR